MILETFPFLLSPMFLNIGDNKNENCAKRAFFISFISCAEVSSYERNLIEKDRVRAFRAKNIFAKNSKEEPYAKEPEVPWEKGYVHVDENSFLLTLKQEWKKKKEPPQRTVQ